MLLPYFGVRRRNEDVRKVHDELTRTEESVSRAMKGLARETISVQDVLTKISAKVRFRSGAEILPRRCAQNPSRTPACWRGVACISLGPASPR